MSKIELEKLLNETISLAQKELDKNGVLAPFGCSLILGKIDLQMALPEKQDSSTKEIIETLKRGLKDKSNDPQTTAMAYCVDMILSEPKQIDAIFVHVEDREGKSVEAYLPYLKKSGDKIEYGEIQFQESATELFNP